MVCKFCRSKKNKFLAKTYDYEYFTSKKSFIYNQCNSCKIVSLASPPWRKLNQIYPKNYYSANYEKNQDRIIKKIIYKAKDLIDKKLFSSCVNKIKKKKIRILDIGGGDGSIAKHLASYSSVTSIDVVDPVINTNSIKHKKIKYIKMRAEEILKLNNKKKYDLIIMLNLIEHVINPQKVMSDLKKLLSKGGLCLIKTPNTKSLNFRIFKKIYWGGYHSPRHFNLFNYENIKLICGGYNIFRIIFTQGVPQWHATLVAILIKLNVFKSKTPFHSRAEFPFVALIFGLLDIFVLKFFKLTDQFFLVLKLDKR